MGHAAASGVLECSLESAEEIALFLLPRDGVKTLQHAMHLPMAAPVVHSG